MTTGIVQILSASQTPTLPTHHKTQKPKKSQRAIMFTASQTHTSQRDHPPPTASHPATQSGPHYQNAQKVIGS